METFQRNGNFPAGQVHMVVSSECARFLERSMVRVSMGLPSIKRIGVKATDCGMQQRHEQPAMRALTCERVRGALAGPGCVGRCGTRASTHRRRRRRMRSRVGRNSSGFGERDALARAGENFRRRSAPTAAELARIQCKPPGAVCGANGRCRRLAATDSSHRQWSCTACKPIQVSNAGFLRVHGCPMHMPVRATLAKQHPTQRWRSPPGTTSDNTTGGYEGGGGTAWWYCCDVVS